MTMSQQDTFTMVDGLVWLQAIRQLHHTLGNANTGLSRSILSAEQH